MDEEKRKNTVFVTVGTTCFDALVKAVDTQQVKEELSRRGYTELVIQMGRGTYVPSKSSGEDGSLAVDYFTFSPSIADYMRSASLVISHAGSGSIFETLRLGKPLIVVVNEDLMDNHQSELAEELAERKHLFCARPQSLHQTIKEMNLESLLAYSSGDAMPVVKLINSTWNHSLLTLPEMPCQSLSSSTGSPSFACTGETVRVTCNMQEILGVFNRNCMICYSAYYNIFLIWALDPR